MDIGLERLTVGTGCGNDEKVCFCCICFGISYLFSHENTYNFQKECRKEDHLHPTSYKPQLRTESQPDLSSSQQRLHFFGHLYSARLGHSIYRQVLAASMPLPLRDEVPAEAPRSPATLPAGRGAEEVL